MDPDQSAIERIKELEADLIAEGQRIDLLQEALDDAIAENRALKGQLQQIKVDRNCAIA